MRPLSTFLLFTLLVSAFSACSDKPGFYDAQGDGCSYYSRNPSACQYASSNRQGVSPKQACCACGGGTGSSTATSATTGGSSRCTDKINYYDADGDSCSFYTRNPSACYNARANRQGVTPRQACCACGGGARSYLEEEFLDATVLATGCTDKAGFYDADGDGCSYYNKKPSACANARANRQGVSPRQACCACGGGSGAAGSTTTTTTTTTGSNARCVDYANYLDADGGDCAMYAKYPNFCANSAIARPNKQGVSPKQACCACGGGARYLLEEDLLDATAVLATRCTDRRNYYDADGDSCSYYTKNPGACANARSNRQGVNPRQACCACGGGSGLLEEELLDTTVLASSCTDRRNYYDADGDSCSYYTKNPGACANARSNRQGVNPRQACCACGGGSGLLEEELLDETVLATSCADKAGFYDADGDSCSYYNKNPNACANARANRQGVSPRQACCACGGGSGALTTVTTSSSNARCVDYANYLDADGGDCAMYAKYPNFCANSAIARPNKQGVSPKQACCACGGGARY